MLENIFSFGINMFEIFFGIGFGDFWFNCIIMLVVVDVDVLVGFFYVSVVMLIVFKNVMVCFGLVVVIVLVNGVGL